MTEIANNSIDIQVVETGGENAQYFWHNTVDSGNGEGAGAHVTQIPKADFISDPENGGGNTLITSNGMAVRNGVDVMANFGNNAITLYTADGVPAFVVNSGSGSSQQTIVKVINQDVYLDKNVNKAKTYADIGNVGSGESFTVGVYDYGGMRFGPVVNTFTKGTSSVQSYTMYIDNSGTDTATVTATYNGTTQITWRFTTSTDASLSGFTMTVDTITYTATVNDATTEISGNMIWKNPTQVFVVENYDKNSVSVNNYTQTTINCVKAGYYPLAIVGWHSSSSYTGVAQCCLINKAVGSCTIDIYLNNTSSSARTTNISYDVLWVKCE